MIEESIVLAELFKTADVMEQRAEHGQLLCMCRNAPHDAEALHDCGDGICMQDFERYAAVMLVVFGGIGIKKMFVP